MHGTMKIKFNARLIGGYMGCRAGLDVSVKTIVWSLSGFEPHRSPNNIIVPAIGILSNVSL